MTKLTRRRLLKVAGATAIGAGGLLPLVARANPVWGDLPSGVLTPPPNFGVLHIHCLGGFAPFESFYYRDVPGQRTRGFDAEVGQLVWNTPACSGTPAPGLQKSPTVFGNDAMGKPVHLGPFAKPLWLRPDIYDRTRVIVQSHDLTPHEGAVPYALTGRRLGNPGQCSLGTAIAHRHLALDAEAGLPPRALPYAYGLVDGSLSTLLEVVSQGMSALGHHPGNAKPLVLKVGGGFATLISQLTRGNMSATKDALLDQYRGQFRDWLRWNGGVTRSRAFRDYDTTVSTLFNAPALSSFLSAMAVGVPDSAECARAPMGLYETSPNPTKTALEAAAFLLTRPPETRARYVCVIDHGLEPRSSMLGYDVHNPGQAEDTGTNLWNLFSNLTPLINEEGAVSDPNKLNLSDTLILITTEFGRTPFKSQNDVFNASSTGRDHWPQAYANILIGGPITSRAVVGSIMDGADAFTVADQSYSPTDVHAAVLLASGINPFVTENFAVGQLTAALKGATEDQTLQNLKSTLLGA